MSHGLVVEQCEVVFTGESRIASCMADADDGSLGWRVVHVCSGLAIPMRFLRKRDAEMAMNAVSVMADWTLPLDEVTKALDPQTIRKAMAEALAW